MRSKVYGSMAVLALAAALAGDASAADKGHGRMFKALDQNGDGVISWDETQASRDRRFARLDTDGDGVVTRAEYDAKAQERFGRFDLNGDGNITEEEANAAREQFRKDKEKKAE